MAYKFTNFSVEGKGTPPAGCDRGRRGVWRRSVESDFVQPQEFDDSLDVEGDNGFLAFFGFQEGKVLRIVEEKILREDGCCVLIPEQVEVLFQIRISVGVVRADAVAGKVFPGSVVEAGGQLGGGFLVEGDVHIVVLFLVIDGDLAVDAAGFDEVPDLFAVEAGSVLSWTRLTRGFGHTTANSDSAMRAKLFSPTSRLIEWCWISSTGIA